MDVRREKKKTYLDMAVAIAQLRNDDRNNEENNSGFKNDLAVILFVVPVAVYVDSGVNFQSMLRRHAW